MFSDLVADVMIEIQFERGKAEQIHKDTKSEAVNVFHVDDLIPASSHQQTAQVWKSIGEHMLLKAHDVMTPDRHIKYLSRQYVKVHAQADGDSKSVYINISSTALQQQWKWSVAGPGLKKAGPTVGQVGQEQRLLGATESPEMQSCSWKTAVYDQRSTAYAVKNLSRQLAKPSGLDVQDLKQRVRYTLGHSNEWLFLSVQDKSRKTEDVATIEVYTDADWAGDAKSIKSTQCSRGSTGLS